MTKDNHKLGTFDLHGIPPAPRGVPQIEVTFDIDANGILNVSAKDLGTGKEHKIEIKASSGLSDDEVKKMVREAEMHASEDQNRRKLIDLRNQADNMAYQAEKSLKEHGEKVDAASRSEVEQAINRLKDAQKTEDVSAIEKAIENLTSVQHKIAEAVYKNAGAAGAPGAAPGGPSADGGSSAKGGKDDVIDAEYEVKS